MLKLDDLTAAPTCDYCECFGMLFTIRTELHLYHLKGGSYAEHMAIGSLYEAMDSFNDRIIESWFGMNGVKDITVPASKVPKNIISYLERAHKLMTGKRELFEDSVEIQAIFDELLEAMSSTLYKIKFLK
jgi:hypothetical protein